MDGKTEAAVVVRREYDCTKQAPGVVALNALADIKNVRTVDLTDSDYCSDLPVRAVTGVGAIRK